ncbi:MAG: hypothetical protein CMJ40_06655 [Phycisphaerae bacterium]|nr:hypothetical protein [Phycisphaerae bacterium]
MDIEVSQLLRERVMTTNFNAGAVFALIAGLGMSGVVTGDFYGLDWEFIHEGDQGSTVRLYAMMESGGRLDLVGGNSFQNLEISSPEGFYQNNLGGPTSRQINSNFFPFVPSLEWDSYVTIGALYQDGTPFGENGLNDVGLDWSTFENGGDLVADSGSWFVGLDHQQGEAQFVNGIGGYGVLIAQLTVSYPQVLFSGILQGQNADGEAWQVALSDYLIGDLNPPAPGALAVLAIAGFAGPRRRRG